MNSFNSFLNLPNNALMHVLREMRIPHLVRLSILSKRAKQLVMDLNLKTDQFAVTIYDTVSIYIEVGNRDAFCLEFYGEEYRNIAARVNNEQPPIKFSIPNPVQVKFLYEQDHRDNYKCNKEGFELKDWINHLMTIFHHSKIDHLELNHRCDRFDFESIHEVFNGCENIYIGDLSRAYFEQIFKTFKPPKRLVLSENLFQNPNDIYNVFIQNFDNLVCCASILPDWPQFGLDDLLIINSSNMRFDNSTLSNKVLNGFIKHWINGSNPKMHHFHMEFHRDIVLNENEILKGIKYEIIPDDQERTFKKSVIRWHHYKDNTIKGGLDFKRNNGTKATILIDNNIYNILEIFVWH